MNQKFSNMTVRAIAMYIRFVTTRIDEDSHQPQGLFMASYNLFDEGDLSAIEREQLEEVLEWFADYLHTPRIFDPCRAVFWYKQNANQFINRMWELANLLRLHGHFIEIQRCHRLANVIFEDNFQVAAYPSRYDGRYTYG